MRLCIYEFFVSRFFNYLHIFDNAKSNGLDGKFRGFRTIGRSIVCFTQAEKIEASQILPTTALIKKQHHCNIFRGDSENKRFSPQLFQIERSLRLFHSRPAEPPLTTISVKLHPLLFAWR